MRIRQTITLFLLMVTFLCGSAEAQFGAKTKGSRTKGSGAKGSSTKGSSTKGSGAKGSGAKGSSSKGSGAKGSGTKKLLTESYQVKFETSAGDIYIEVHPEWAPIGATHFKDLVDAKFYDDARFFRVLDNFMAQVGMHADPKQHAKFSAIKIKDEAVKKSNTRGYISYGKSSLPNSRSTHIFINFGNNSYLDRSGFAPFAKVIKGMDVVDKLYSGYGSKSTNQGAIAQEGNTYLKKNFPKLDYIKTARVLQKKDEVKAERVSPK